MKVLKSIVGRKEHRMIILAVITGYLLGVLPFLFFYAINGQIKVVKKIKEDANEETNMADIMNEWLNGPAPVKSEESNKEKEDKPVAQISKIYTEFITGEENGGNNE